MLDITLGIIGSGQLGSLLCQAATKLKIKTKPSKIPFQICIFSIFHIDLIQGSLFRNTLKFSS